MAPESTIERNGQMGGRENDPIKVAIALRARFWAFDLARELDRQGLNTKLYSGFPYFRAKDFGIRRDNYQSLFVPELLPRLGKKLPLGPAQTAAVDQFSKKLFDNMLSLILPKDLDVFVGWSQSCLKAFAAAKKNGAVTIVERGSSHILSQKQILEEEWERQGKKFAGIPQQVIEREIGGYEAADYLAVPSTFVMNSFLERGFPREKILLNPFGVDTDVFRPLKEHADDTFRFIFAGGVTLRKGAQYLLQAFDELNLPDAELWFVGEKNVDATHLVQKYESNPKIVFHGSKRQEDLPQYYSACNAFVLPSIEEGLAMVQLQAMACGLPVIHTFNSGASDVVDDGQEGFCIPLRDIDALKEKMLWCYENQEATKAMGEQAMNRTRMRHKWSDYAAQAHQYYKDLLSRS